MTLEKIKEQFDAYLASMTDEEIIAEFKKRGCDVVIVKPEPSKLVRIDFTISHSIVGENRNNEEDLDKVAMDILTNDLHDIVDEALRLKGDSLKITGSPVMSYNDLPPGYGGGCCAYLPPHENQEPELIKHFLAQ